MLNALTTCAPVGGGLGDFLRAGSALRGEKAPEIGGDGVGDVDDDLAVQGIPVLTNHRRRAGVRHGEDDDVPGRGGVGHPDRGAAERGGQLLGLDRVAADDLDCVAAGECPAGQGAGHVAGADDADAAHDASRLDSQVKRLTTPP